MGRHTAGAGAGDLIERYGLALKSGSASPPMNRTDSWRFSTCGVIAHVPPQAAVAIFSAVSAPPNGKLRVVSGSCLPPPVADDATLICYRSDSPC